MAHRKPSPVLNPPQSPVIPSSLNLEVQAYQSSINLQSQVFLSAFGQDAYIFKLHSLPLQLPEDYSCAFQTLTEIVSDKLINVEVNTKSDTVLTKLKDLITTLMKAAKQIIYNFEGKVDEVVVKTEKCFNDLHTEICNINIAHINLLLQEAKKDFLMCEQTKKNLFFNVKLEDESLKFVELFMNKARIDIKELMKSFYEIFSIFFKEKVDFLRKFEIFNKKISEIKEEKFREYKLRFQNELFDYFMKECEYLRVAVYCAKITEEFKLKEIDGYKWILMCCLVMQKDEFTLSKPIEIAKNVMLIPLLMKNESFIIHYSHGSQPNLAKIVDTCHISVIQGSTPEKTYLSIAKDQKVQENALIVGKLDKKEDINLLIKENEQINDIIFISETQRFLMVVNNSKLIIRTIGSKTRSELIFNDMDQGVLSINLYTEKKLVCIKSSNMIKFYNVHMQCLSSFNVEGNILCGVTTLNDQGYIILIAENKVIELKFVTGQDSMQESSRLVELKAINPCSYSMSKDRMDLTKSKSKYMGAAHRNFAVPDKNPAFRHMISLSLEPDLVILKKEVSQNPMFVNPRLSSPNLYFNSKNVPDSLFDNQRIIPSEVNASSYEYCADLQKFSEHRMENQEFPMNFNPEPSISMTPPLVEEPQNFPAVPILPPSPLIRGSSFKYPPIDAGLSSVSIDPPKFQPPPILKNLSGNQTNSSAPIIPVLSNTLNSNGNNMPLKIQHTPMIPNVPGHIAVGYMHGQGFQAMNLSNSLPSSNPLPQDRFHPIFESPNIIPHPPLPPPVMPLSQLSPALQAQLSYPKPVPSHVQVIQNYPQISPNPLQIPLIPSNPSNPEQNSSPILINQNPLFSNNPLNPNPNPSDFNN